MTTEFKKLKLQNRIALLEGRSGKDNGKIVKKLRRQLKNIQEEK